MAQNIEDPQKIRDLEKAKQVAKGNAKTAELITSHPELTHLATTVDGNRLAIPENLAEVYRSKLEKGKLEAKAGRRNFCRIAKVEPITAAGRK